MLTTRLRINPKIRKHLNKQIKSIFVYFEVFAGAQFY